ncbi:MAG TPA: creatininase family protein, partial [Aestuariivirgaceae bacterium]|nr:creatininase family protein [Aestuariivirgaceae bacterium]
MRYEMMLPHQIRRAITDRWPIVLPLGVLEYHGEHMAVGMDTLAVVKLLEIL